MFIHKSFCMTCGKMTVHNDQLECTECQKSYTTATDRIYDRSTDPTIYHCQHSRIAEGDKYCRDCGKRL